MDKPEIDKIVVAALRDEPGREAISWRLAVRTGLPLRLVRIALSRLQDNGVVHWSGPVWKLDD